MLELVALVVGWYLSSCVAITTSKICMQMVKVPFILCTAQCVTAVLVTLMYLFTRGGRYDLVRSQEKVEITKISFAYSAGFGLTNVAFAIASAPFVETVKASEPVSTALLAIFFLGERESVATYTSLFPIILGVVLATSVGSGASMSTNLFSLATLVITASNICFSLRAIFTKQLKRNYSNSNASRSAVVLFYHVSRIGLPGFLIAALANQELSVLTELFFSSSKIKEQSPNFLVFIAALIANGLAYTCYNMASFMVLARVTTTTHAVLNVFRRVVVIAITTLYFRTPITISGLSGVLIAAVGVALFASSKAADPKAS
mmetsp:Transcript_13804/g.18436  ORF Transcript_13804/g.18436 Transcript_13804/m.18436 type:complete len:318 (+) Transcript_13804:164-1117(+)